MDYLFKFWFILGSVVLADNTLVLSQNKLAEKDYTMYHRTIASAHKYITEKEYQKALDLYRQVVDDY